MNENLARDLQQLPGPRLRQLRSIKRLSLQALADLAGSSPSAVHRYESGWGSFELRTLARLAAALGARLEISIVPVVRESKELLTPRQLISLIRPLFWDVDITADHLQDNPEWVVRRVLQFGTWEDVHQVRRYFGDEAVRRAASHRSMDSRTKHFWHFVLGPGNKLQ